MRLISIIFALVAGILLPTQAGINAQLAKQLGHPLLAATVSFLVGALALFLFTLAIRIPVPSYERAIEVPWSLWLGGLLGAMYLTATIILAPILGAANTIGLVVTGQILAAIAIDHFGLVGFPVHALSFWRIIGGILLITGVVLVQKN